MFIKSANSRAGTGYTGDVNTAFAKGDKMRSVITLIILISLVKRTLRITLRTKEMLSVSLIITQINYK